MRQTYALLIALLVSSACWAGDHVGECLFPKTTTGKDGRLHMVKPIEVSSAPGEKASGAFTSFSAVLVAEQKLGLVRIVTIPDYSLANPDSVAGKNIGWVRYSDFRTQDSRNCR